MRRVPDITRSGNDMFEYGEVVGLDMSRENYNDGTSSMYPTGLVIVRLFKTGADIKVPYLMPSAGKSQFVGSLPESGAITLLANTGRSDSPSYVVVGFLPVPISKMVAVRKEMSRMTAGETVIQGSVNGGGDFWRAARTKWDEYGRFIITSGDDDLQIIVGDALSNEYTPNVAITKDAITGSTIIYKMTMKGSATTITRDGSMVQEWNRILQQIGGDWLTVLKGKFVVSSGDQIKLSARGEDANYLVIDGTGITMGTIGKFILETTGKVDITSGDRVIIASMLDMAYMAGGNLQLKAAKDLLLTCSGNLEVSIPGTDPTVGKITMTANNSVSLLSLAGIVYLKAISATPQSIIRGETFLAWLNTPNALIGGGTAPITVNPAIPNNPATMAAQLLSTQVKVP